MRRPVLLAAGALALGVGLRPDLVEAMDTGKDGGPVIPPELIRETEAKLRAEREAVDQAERYMRAAKGGAQINRRTGKPHEHNRARARRLRQLTRSA